MSNEKYPTKRAYAVGKLYKFLHEKDIYKKYVKECKKQKAVKGRTQLFNSFIYSKTDDGHKYWSSIDREFVYYQQGEQIDKT